MFDRMKLNYILIIVLITGLAGFGAYEYVRSDNLRKELESSYQRSFTELVDSVSNINNLLTKTMVTNNPEYLAELSNKLWHEATLAKTNLGNLPISTIEIDKTTNFLSQVGNYTVAISKKVTKNEKITTEETNELHSLIKYSDLLNKQLQEFENGLALGTFRFLDNTNKVNLLEKNMPVFSDELNYIEEKFTEYTSLIYDGPFAENVINIEPALIKDNMEITPDKAKDVVLNFLNINNAQAVKYVSDGEGNIKTYNFAVDTGQEDRQITVEVTKKGGVIKLILDNRKVISNQLDIKIASENASAFLKKRGINNMKQTGYIIEDNIVVLAFAYIQDDFTIYPDLIKVKIALDNGEMVGYEAHGYITHHVPRKLPNVRITEEQAISHVRDGVQIENVKFALIPLENGLEVFCYEVRAKAMEKTFLIYVNVENATEEKILMLIESEKGSLTI